MRPAHSSQIHFQVEFFLMIDFIMESHCSAKTDCKTEKGIHPQYIHLLRCHIRKRYQRLQSNERNMYEYHAETGTISAGTATTTAIKNKRL